MSSGSMSSDKRSKKKLNCTDCGCPSGEQSSSICFIESSKGDKMVSFNSNQISDCVWKHVKPPMQFGSSIPLVSARKLDVTRSQLTGKLKPRRPAVPVQGLHKCIRKSTEE